MKKKTIGLLFGSVILSLGAVVLSTAPKKDVAVTFATYTNGDAATYYNSIDSSKSGNALLTDLRNLNLSKRQSTVGYNSMGTTPAGQFKYTDYDPDYVQYDSNGQPYGTRISSFYTYTSATSWNREHVWPNSHGGGSGGDAGSPYPDADIHMPRPTISSENSSRGNSFFVEGMNHSSNGWDPYAAGYSANSRGEAARITFYCTLVNAKLNLAPNNTAPSGTDPVTGTSYGSGHTMGNLETLIKWNINYPVNQREKNRNEGAEYLQGNRNPFVDHPEYACKIWGNVNSTIKSMCDNASWDTGPSVNLTKSILNMVVDDETTIAAYSSDSSQITWSTSDYEVATVNVATSSSGENVTITAVGPGTATITAEATINSTVYSASCSVTVSSGGGGGGGGDTPIGDEFVIYPSDLATSYPKSDTSYTTASGITVTCNQCANFSSKIQFKNGAGYLYNNTSLNLGTLTLDIAIGSFTVYAGNTRNPSTNAVTGTNGVYDLTGYNYFKIVCNSGSMGQCNTITINLATAPEKTLSSISVSSAPTKTTYTAGEYFNPTGLVITRNYSDSTSDTYTYSGHTSEFSFSPNTSTALTTSNVSVTITYGGKSCNQAITVNAAKTLSSISVSTAPTKTVYTAGETFDPTGLVIRRNYSDSTYDTYSYSGHTSEFTFSPSLSTALSTGNTSVSITYGGKSTSQAISVNPAAKTLDYIYIDGTPKSVYSVGDTFEKPTVIASFSDGSSADVTESAVFSGYDMSQNNIYTVTVSYTYKGLTETDSFQITVSKVTTETVITASVSKTFYVGEFLTMDDIDVRNASTDQKVYSFLFNGYDNFEYQFTYTDALAGGLLTDKVFENGIFALGTFCDLVVQVQRKERVESAGGSYSVTYTDLPGAYSTNTNERTAASGIKFIAYNCANYSSKMQFQASGGYFQTSEGLDLRTVTINNPSGKSLTVYGSNNASSFTQTIVGTENVYDLTGYRFVKIMKNGSGAAYCASIDIAVGTPDTAENVANYIMFEDLANQCSFKLDEAIVYLQGLSDDEVDTFVNSDNYVITCARTRLEAWAANQGKTINYNGASGPELSEIGRFDDADFNSNLMIIVIAISSISALAFTTLLLIKKKRK